MQLHLTDIISKLAAMSATSHYKWRAILTDVTILDVKFGDNKQLFTLAAQQQQASE